MAKTKKIDFKAMPRSELETRVREVEALIFETKMKKVTGQLANTGTQWMQRKELARLKTALTASLTANQKK
ncbi:MAG: 50S ribosomal protein L29 [Bdellovibrionota bacterium]